MMFDFIDGAAGVENTSRDNRESIEHYRLLPRVLRNVENINLSKSIVGQSFDVPFGIAPMGMCNLAWPGADRILANAAATNNLPHCVSTMASSSMGDIAKVAGANAWFQLYVSGAANSAWPMVEQARKDGYEVLILTVDVPRVAPRIRELKHGFHAPLKIRARHLVDFALHPRWSLTTLANGIPQFGNASVIGNGKGINRDASRGGVDWDFLHQLREKWPGKLIVKGVLSGEDAKAIKNSGADAIYVSNHGGRQLDSAPAAINMLPKIRHAVGQDFPLLFDSGVRGGEAIIKALALGANFVLLGRPFLYAVGADGGHGVETLIELLKNEIRTALAQIGHPDINTLDNTVFVR
jgi:isopentenyl diphosphate isomerase/L-lactate dehydrogenase-like FMN-dependent dehydrogenase